MEQLNRIELRGNVGNVRISEAGTGKMALASGDHPGQMKDAVCSPAGTTIVGVAALEKNGFRYAVIDAVDQIENKIQGKL